MQTVYAASLSVHREQQWNSLIPQSAASSLPVEVCKLVEFQHSKLTEYCLL